MTSTSGQSGERCEQCRFWDRQNAWGEKKDKAACRVSPPRIRGGGLACDATGAWPSTVKTDWCGSFCRFVPTPKEQGS